VKATHKNNLNRNIKNYKHMEPEENASSIFDDKFCTRRNHYIKLRKLPNQGRSVFIIVWEDFFQLRIGDVKATIERSKCNPIKGWLKTVPCGCRSKSTKNKSYRDFSTFFLNKTTYWFIRTFGREIRVTSFQQNVVKKNVHPRVDDTHLFHTSGHTCKTNGKLCWRRLTHNICQR
jgi:hypothetical protein